MTDALTRGAIADLIVILNKADEMIVGQRSDRPAEGPLAKLRMAPVVSENIGQYSCEIGKSSEIGVIAVVLASKQRVQGMMELIVPLRSEAVTAGRDRCDEARLIQVAFRN